MPIRIGLQVVRLAKPLVSRYIPGLFVLVSYGISLLVFFWLYTKFSDTRHAETILHWNADATGFLVRILSIDASVQDNVVTSGPLALTIVLECTSLPFLSILFAGIIAFPSTIFQKLWGAVLGAVILSLVNLVRTTSLLLIGLSFPSALDSAHILVWQALMIITAVSLWILWWRNIEGRERLQT